MFDAKRITTIAAAVIAVAAVLTGASARLHAEEGRLHITFVKSRSVVGSGNLFLDGQRYRIAADGIGATAIGAARVDLVGTVSGLRNASDILGAYSALDAGTAVLKGAKTALMKNGNGAVIELQAVNLKNASLDLGGLTITASGWGAHP
jgi:hypothetical protein